jgi:hypothetical protein
MDASPRASTISHQPAKATGPTTASRKSGTTLADIVGDRARVLEQEVTKLRQRVRELELRQCASGDVGSVVLAAVTEAMRGATPDQRAAVLAARATALETELATRSSLARDDEERRASAELVTLEQNVQLLSRLEELTQREEEHKRAKQELRRLTERTKELTESEARAREDAKAEAQSASKLREDLLKARSERVEAMRKLHEKHREELAVQAMNEQQLRDRLAKQEQETAQVLDAHAAQATAQTVQQSESQVLAAVNDLALSLAVVPLRLEELRSRVEGTATKIDLTDLAASLDHAVQNGTDCASAEEKLASLRESIARFAEEYGAVDIDRADPVASLTTALRATQSAYDARVAQEKQRLEAQRAHYEEQLQVMQRAQDELLNTVEYTLTQMNELARSKGLTEPQVRALASPPRASAPVSASGSAALASSLAAVSSPSASPSAPPAATATAKARSTTDA